MLIEFSVKNFLSFKERTTFSMVAAKPFKEHEESHIIETTRNFKLLKSSVIYGNNGSGKSNLTRAMLFMKTMVINSLYIALGTGFDRKFSLQKFALDAASEKEPAFFEIIFLVNGIIYRYGFEIDHDRVISEWLFHTTSKEVYLFKRNLQVVQINRSSFKEGIGREQDLKESVLFLTLLATFNKKISADLLTWFDNFKIITGINDIGYKRYTVSKLKEDQSFLNWASIFLRFLEITNIATNQDTGSADITNEIEHKEDEDVANLISALKKLQAKQPAQDKVLTFHRKYGPENILLDTVPFDLEEDESEGTKKLIYLLGPWYDALKNGKVLVVDELDSRLHSLLTIKLIELFNNKQNYSAQLICAVHDTSILDKDVFRRDQIWFVEKNQFGASELVSLGEFKTGTVRNRSSFSKNYLDGRYGAVPYFTSGSKLDEVMYGKE